MLGRNTIVKMRLKLLVVNPLERLTVVSAHAPSSATDVTQLPVPGLSSYRQQPRLVNVLPVHEPLISLKLVTTAAIWQTPAGLEELTGVYDLPQNCVDIFDMAQQQQEEQPTMLEAARARLSVGA